MFERLVIVLRQVIGNFGVDFGVLLIQLGLYIMCYVLEVFMIDDEVLNVLLGFYGLFQQDLIFEIFEEGFIQFFDGMVFLIEVDVFGIYMIENDVNVVVKFVGKVYIIGILVIGMWMNLFVFDFFVQVIIDGLVVLMFMGISLGLGCVQVDGGNGMIGVI